MTETHYRTCPLCEATCGLEISVTDGKVVRIRGDRDDVFSRGFICPKGSTLKQLHEDPDRLRTPQRRTATGHIDVSWDDAFRDIDARLRAIIDEHGPNAVGVYLGNPNVHTLAGPFWIAPILRALGSRNIFSASTVDQVPRNVSSGLMFGDPYAVLIPDLDRTSYLLMLGANPYESNGSLATAPDWPGRMRAISERGGRVVVVDPRRTRSAAAADEHLFVRPGTDALLLCALANVIVADGLVDLGGAAHHLAGLDEALAAVASCTPERAAAASGIDAETIRRIAHELASADSACVYGRVGVHTVAGGTVASWATDLLNVITGNLDRPGGAMWGLAPHARPRPAAGGGRGYRIGRWTSRVSGRSEVTGELPTAVLAEEIETEGAGQIRALITIAGNPVLTTPHSERLDAALAGLEYMVSVDLYLNETTRHADVVLPVPSQLEKSHYDAVFFNQSVRQVAKWTPPVFATEQPSETDVLARLTLLLRGKGPDADPAIIGDELLDAVLAHAVDDPHSNVFGRDALELRTDVDGDTAEDRLVDAQIRTGRWGDGFGADPDGLRLTMLAGNPHGIDLGALEPRLPANLRTPSAKVELAPPEILDAMPALLDDIERRTVLAEGELLLVGRRDVRSNNSWMHNIDVLVRGRARCTLLMHAIDASSRGIAAGDTVIVRSRVGALETPVELTDDLMPGVVSLPHGWGHAVAGTRLGVAAGRPGVNSNVLTDGDVLDPISGNATLNGIPVTVVAL